MTADPGEPTPGVDTFDDGSLGQSWTQTGGVLVDDDGNFVLGFDGSRDGTTFAITCIPCGHTIVVCRGDDPIPHGDPRLCEHMGGPAR